MLAGPKRQGLLNLGADWCKAFVMIEMSLETLLPGTALVILAGSMLGSVFIYVSGSAPRSEPPSTGYQRPADWPRKSGGVATYNTAQATDPGSETSLLAAFFVGAVTFLGGTIGTTIYQSPWAPDTTRRHMGAALHCDLAELVALAPARAGEPGYHARNDRDRNDIACETYAGAFDLTAKPTKLSKMQLSWHGTTGTNQGLARQ